MDQRKTHPSHANPARARASRVTASRSNRTSAHPASQLLDELAKQVRRTLKSADAGAVHDLRVKIRRLNQALKVFESSLSAGKRHAFRSSLKKMMTLAGAVRNCDITMKLVSRSKWAGPALQSGIERERQNAEKALTKSMRQWLSYNAASAWTPVRSAAFKESARRALLSIGRRFFARGATAANGARPQELHKFRIATKKFRYSLELFAPVYGPGLNVWLERIKEIQSLLGEINDYETARHMVAGVDSKGSASNGNRKVVADLKEKQRAEVKQFHKLWTPEVAREWKHSILPALRDPKAGLQAPGPKKAALQA